MAAPKPVGTDDQAELNRLFGSLGWNDESDWKEISTQLLVQKFPRGWRLVSQGESLKYVGFILQGIFKLQRTGGDGKVSINSFPAEGELACDYPALYTRRPSEYSIEAIEPGRIVLLPVEAYNTWTESKPLWKIFGRGRLEESISRLIDREFALLHLDATQRHERFVAQTPGILPRIKLKDLAAYLGITPVSFSRLSAQRITKKRHLSELY